MSAIWGVVTLDQTEMVPEKAKELFEAFYKENCKIERYESVADSKVYMGCGIQYITEESKSEKLPIVDKERGIIFTADCILDNRDEVVELLSGYGYDRKQLWKEPDGMLMYFTYINMGQEGIKRFRGLFSIAIWNEKKNSLTLISDQVSARCLYCIRRGNLIAFSTLMNPLVKLFPDMEQNMNYYKDFLLANPTVIYVVPGETPYKDISLMLPATELEFCIEGEHASTYWSLEDKTFYENACKSAKEYGNRFLEIYDSCVKDALRSSGEVGIAMSSGLDSSSIGALAARELEKQEKMLYSYTFVPYQKAQSAIEGNIVYDESGLVNELAEMYPNMKTTFLNNQGRNIFEDMDFCMNLLEMPYKTGTFPNHYEMCTEGAKVGCKVFLNGGFGNNTVSFGEINHILYDLYRKKRYGSMLQYMNRYGKHEKIGRRKMFEQLLKVFRIFDQKHESYLEHFVPDNFFLLPSILEEYDFQTRFSVDKRMVISEGYIDRESYKEHLRATGLLMYLGVFETKFGLKTGMLLRDPTKDIRIMSFCAQLPFSVFAYQGIPRWLIRNQFEGLLPKTLLEKWQQKGVLNIDWMKRIYRDWERIKPELLSNISTDILEEWVDKKRIIHAIESFGEEREKDIYVMSYLCAMDALIRFIKSERF